MSKSKTRMDWFKMYNTFIEDPKWEHVDLEKREACIVLWVAALCWSAKHQTDGQIPASLSFATAWMSYPIECKDQLLAAGWWTTTDDHRWLYINNYPRWNTTREQRQQASERASKAVRSRWDNTKRIRNEYPIKNRELRNKKELKTSKEVSSSSDVRLVFEYWQNRTGKMKARLTDKRRKLIASCIKGYGIDDAKRVVDGAMSSPWHTGKNPNGTKYLSVELLYRNAEKIEQFIEFAENPPKANKEHLTEAERHIDEIIDLEQRRKRRFETTN